MGCKPHLVASASAIRGRVIRATKILAGYALSLWPLILWAIKAFPITFPDRGIWTHSPYPV